MNRKPLYAALVLTSLMLALHLFALDTYFYWHHRWFDIPMHILGGAALGALLIAFIGTGRATLYFVLMLGVVLGWEVFEYVGHISTGQPDYWLDTSKDMIDGLLGAAIFYYFAKKPVWR